MTHSTNSFYCKFKEKCFVILVAKRDRTCACIVTHTYKQIRKLWDNPDKTNATQNAIKMLGKFDADIDRSTSSDTGISFTHLISYNTLSASYHTLSTAYGPTAHNLHL